MLPDEPVDIAESPEDASAEKAAADELETALKAEKDKYLRLAAEFDNYRKRTIKERESLYNELRAETIVRFLPVYDNLARALTQACADEAFYKGVEMTMTQLREIMQKLGVAEIPAVGETFDPDRHNAVMHIEDAAFQDGEIVEEFEKGFLLGDKVIRFSMVKVAN
ncbi:nucleotide exchange factor GrpE [Oscillospiraceae bacterium CM]|nr:nucleotide exchange factor GrpE [Oscillospiraceae bacterium CM]